MCRTQVPIASGMAISSRLANPSSLVRLSCHPQVTTRQACPVANVGHPATTTSGSSPMARARTALPTHEARPTSLSHTAMPILQLSILTAMPPLLLSCRVASSMSGSIIRFRLPLHLGSSSSATWESTHRAIMVNGLPSPNRWHRFQRSMLLRANVSSISAVMTTPLSISIRMVYTTCAQVVDAMPTMRNKRGLSMPNTLCSTARYPVSPRSTWLPMPRACCSRPTTLWVISSINTISCTKVNRLRLKSLSPSHQNTWRLLTPWYCAISHLTLIKIAPSLSTIRRTLRRAMVN